MNETNENSHENNMSFLWAIHNDISEAIRFSDMKAGAIITIQTIIWGFIFSNTISFIQLAFSPTSNFLIKVIGFAFAIFSLLTIIIALLSVHPTLKVGKPNSLIYFAHIAKSIKMKQTEISRLDATNEYINNIINLNKEEREHEIAEGIWALSIIAWKKYYLISISIKFLLASLIMLVVMVLFR